jgi:hypothetical protein
MVNWKGFDIQHVPVSELTLRPEKRLDRDFKPMMWFEAGWPRLDKVAFCACSTHKEVIMKSLLFAVVASALALPLAAFAQSDLSAPLTRAQVQADLQQWEQAGYHPVTNEDASYPRDVQAAEARLTARNSTTGYGGVMSGSSASGSPVFIRPASPQEMRQLYQGGQ